MIKSNLRHQNKSSLQKFHNIWEGAERESKMTFISKKERQRFKNKKRCWRKTDRQWPWSRDKRFATESQHKCLVSPRKRKESFWTMRSRKRMRDSQIWWKVFCQSSTKNKAESSKNSWLTNGKLKRKRHCTNSWSQTWQRKSLSLTDFSRMMRNNILSNCESNLWILTYISPKDTFH